jgi:putative tryptophan/tyrosine transport system substrate-binding protein
MRRRDFVFGFSGAALAMLDSVRGQQVARVWRVGTVGPEPRDRGQYLVDAFSQKLAEYGYQQGRNIDLTVHFTEARIEKIEESLIPLVGNLDLLVIWSTIGLIAAKKVVPPALPTVFLGVGDPVRIGAVQSLSHPGGNMTGVTYESATETWAKRIELLKEIVPNLDRVGVLKAGNDPNSAYAMASLEPWLPALGVTIVAVDFTSTEELDAAFSEMMRKNVKGLLVISGALTFANGKRISELALERGMPSVHGFREIVALGGLVSLGPELAAIARQGARLADKIMKGEKPANIPVEEPTVYEVWLNLRTARVLSITVPASVTARADRVIE